MFRVVGRTGIADLAEVEANRLEIGNIYVMRMPGMTDDGDLEYTNTLIVVMDGGMLGLNGVPRKKLRLVETNQDFFLSQIPASKYYGPIKLEWNE